MPTGRGPISASEYWVRAYRGTPTPTTIGDTIETIPLTTFLTTYSWAHRNVMVEEIGPCASSAKVIALYKRRGLAGIIRAVNIFRTVFKVADVHRNVILFGRPSTNQLLASVVEQLPIQWNDETLIVNGKTYSAKTHVPVMIYPLPIGSKLFSTEHYVVINSGFTYREYAYLNNARQVPMLPDWAVVDISQGATTQLPGKIVDAGFFDENWEF